MWNRLEIARFMNCGRLVRYLLRRHEQTYSREACRSRLVMRKQSIKGKKGERKKKKNKEQKQPSYPKTNSPSSRQTPSQLPHPVPLQKKRVIHHPAMERRFHPSLAFVSGRPISSLPKVLQSSRGKAGGRWKSKKEKKNKKME